jgi:hypothetical protein
MFPLQNNAEKIAATDSKLNINIINSAIFISLFTVIA